jgi:nucleoside-diphosphate-sugar epimerase
MIVDAIAPLIRDPKIRFQEHGSDPRNYRVDFRKIRERLGFEPSQTVPDGIRELIGALDARLFDEADARRNFHGNYEIAYP